MLTLTWLPRQACQKSVWKEFDPSRQIWIVSDAKTKFFLEKSLLQSNQVISNPVQRAKEFLKDLLRLADPEVKVLENLGSKIFARDFLLREGTSEWCQRPHAPEKLLEACQSLGPLLINKDAAEILSAFESEFGQKSGGPFLELATLGAKFYRECVEKKILPRFFLPFYLYELDRPLVMGKEIIFDFAFDMRVGEKELIQHLSKSNDVNVLIPAASEERLGEMGLSTYRHFDLGVAHVKHRHIQDESPQAPLTLWRCSSPEAEARKAVEKVASLVAQGVVPEEICIVAPRISDYENILSHDLEWEGIGFQRTLKTRLSASRLYRALDARLQIINGPLNSGLLEEAFLSVAAYKVKLQRRDERRVLKPIIREEQIPSDVIQKQIVSLKRKRKKGPLTILEFEKILIEVFEDLISLTAVSNAEKSEEAEQRNQLFLRALQKLRGEVSDGHLEFSLWLEAWQEVTASMSLNYRQAVEGGVWGVDMGSCEEVSSPYLIILGALESGGQASVAASLSDDKLSFFKQLGFDFSSPMRKRNDPLMQWLLTGHRSEIILSCAKTDSTGRAVAASALWVRLAADQKKDLEKLEYATHTRWIDVQKTALSGETAAQINVFKNWKAGTAEHLGALVGLEVGGLRRVQLPVQKANPLPITMSASRIEAYWDCPYKFFARSYLGLFDEADLEVEPSPQAKGQWLHVAVEKILSHPEVALESWDAQKLSELVDSLDLVQKQVSSDIWPNIRTRFIRQLARFIENEIQWRKDYPLAKPQEFEAALKGKLGWAEKAPGIRFSLEDSEHEFWAEFKGSIDRIDLSQKKAVILDYKSGGNSASNIPSWKQRGSFQLALYSEAVEAGLLNKEPYKVIAAQYYSLKKLNREKGFRLSDLDLDGILPASGSPKASVDQKARDGYFDEINESVRVVLEKIRLGEMTPVPHSEKNCNTCSWRTSCRAPHLD